MQDAWFANIFDILSFVLDFLDHRPQVYFSCILLTNLSQNSVYVYEKLYIKDWPYEWSTVYENELIFVFQYLFILI